MASLKKYCNIPANSILESVIALSIISICLYIAIMIVSAVFTKKTTAKFYDTQNKMNELFFIAQLQCDSLIYDGIDENLIVEEEIINTGLKKIKVEYKDSTQIKFEKSFYVQIP